MTSKRANRNLNRRKIRRVLNNLDVTVIPNKLGRYNYGGGISRGSIR